MMPDEVSEYLFELLPCHPESLFSFLYTRWQIPKSLRWCDISFCVTNEELVIMRGNGVNYFVSWWIDSGNVIFMHGKTGWITTLMVSAGLFGWVRSQFCMFRSRVVVFSRCDTYTIVLWSSVTTPVRLESSFSPILFLWIPGQVKMFQLYLLRLLRHVIHLLLYYFKYRLKQHQILFHKVSASLLIMLSLHGCDHICDKHLVSGN